MPNVIAIISDERARRQTEQFLQQLGMDDLRFATFESQQEFASLYFRDHRTESEIKLDADGKPLDPQPGPDAADLKLFSEVNLLIYALDSIGGEKSGPWMDKVKVNLKRFHHWPQKAPFRMVMLKYEDDGLSKLDVLNPLLDDLIYLPLDRLVFLQKMEIFLNLPKRQKPRFLFNQAVSQEIEISKIAKMDRLSDVGLAIRNPMPLRKGLPGHFYIQVPGEKARLEIRAKVFRTEPHPDFPGQYLVYFTYFGLAKSDLSTIRRSLSKAPRYQSLYTDDRSVFRFRPEDLFMQQSDSKTFGIAVIDSDNAIASNLAYQLNKDLDRVKATAETSYSLFIHKNFESASGSTTAKTPPKITEMWDFYQLPLKITLAVADLKCVSVEPAPNPGDLYLGHNAAELFAKPEKWLSLITDKGSRLVLEESIQFAEKGRTFEKLIIMQDETDSRRAVSVKVQRGSADHLVSVEVGPASLSDIAVKLSNDERNKDLDVMILDAPFVPEDPQGWIENLRTRAMQVGLIKDPAALKFFLLSDNETKVNEYWLNIPDIVGLFIKPVDTRQLGFLLSEYLPNKNTVYQFENLGWSQPNLPIHVSKSVHLEALSEFGVTLKSKQTLAPGTMIYLRKSIYVNAPNQCLAARIYACDPHPSEKGYFQVFATYFGINDQFLKFARTWIRENYATQKSKEG